MSDVEVLLSRDITREQLIAELRALRPEFEREGVTGMVLFGSRARGDNRADSDSDLAIDVDESRKFSLLDLAGLHHIVEDAVRRTAHVTMRRGLRPSLLASVVQDGLVVI